MRSLRAWTRSGIFSDSSNVPSIALGTEFAQQRRESAMNPVCQEKPAVEISAPQDEWRYWPDSFAAARGHAWDQRDLSKEAGNDSLRHLGERLHQGQHHGLSSHHVDSANF